MADIHVGHFEEDRVRLLTNSVFHCAHKSFNVYAIAFNFFCSYDTHIWTQADIHFMNAKRAERSIQSQQPMSQDTCIDWDLHSQLHSS